MIKSLQRALCRLGWYPPRAKIDGLAGKMYRAAVLGFKQRLVDCHGVDPSEIAFGDLNKNEDRAIVDATTRDLIMHAAIGGEIGGVAHPLIPTKDLVLDADIRRDEIIERLESRIGKKLPVDLYALIVQHESRWDSFFDLGEGQPILIWGADYTGLKPWYPEDLERLSPPYVRSRGYGLGQVTAPGLPAKDPYSGTPDGRWPSWCLSIESNLLVGAVKIFAEKFRYQKSLRHGCSFKPVFSCGRCISEIHHSGAGYDRGRQEPCSWLEACGRYAGDGAKAQEMIDEVIQLAVRS